MAKITATATETIIGAGSNDSALVVGQDGGFNGGQLAGMRNLIINGGFNINQRGYASGAAVGANLYAHDRWKMAASADTYTFATVANKTTVTIPAGQVLRQVVEGLNLQTGTYVLSWEGTAQGKIGAGAYGATGITGSITGGTDTTIEFGPGTVSNVQLEWGTRASPFERRFVGLELQLCQRYYWAPVLPSYMAASVITYCIAANFVLPVTMRVAPIVTHNFTDANWSGTAVSGVQWGAQTVGISYITKTGTIGTATSVSMSTILIYWYGATWSGTGTALSFSTGSALSASAEL